MFVIRCSGSEVQVTSIRRKRVVGGLTKVNQFAFSSAGLVPTRLSLVLRNSNNARTYADVEARQGGRSPASPAQLLSTDQAAKSQLMGALLRDEIDILHPHLGRLVRYCLNSR